MRKSFRPGLVLMALMLVIGEARADDWPQWNGPNRDGRIREAGFPETFQSSNVKELWQAPIAGGYSGPAVYRGRVYVTDFVRKSGTSTNNPADRDKLKGEERIHCFDQKSGKLIWTREYPVEYSISYAAGPRATPSIDNDLLYSLGSEGDLYCLDANDGNVVWKKQLRDEYKTETPIWGYSSHPLVLDDQLIVMAGGKGSTVVSLDKKTGAERWRSGNATAIGYAPPMYMDVGGVNQLLVWDADAIRSLNPKSGTEEWSTPLAPSFAMSIMSPVVHGDRLFASGIGQVSGMFRIEKDGKGLTTLWNGKPKTSVYCSNSTPVFDGEYLYGNDCEKGTLMCVEASTGKRVWESYKPTSNSERPGRHASVFIARAGSMYYLFSETGDLISASLSASGYEEKSRIHLIDPSNECFGRQVVWSYPAYSNAQVIVRNDNVIKCFSLK